MEGGGGVGEEWRAVEKMNWGRRRWKEFSGGDGWRLMGEL